MTTSDISAHKKGITLFPHEWVMLGYTLITLVFMLMTWSDLVNPGEMIKTRLIALAVLGAGLLLTHFCENRFTRYVRVASVMMTLSIWYPDTYEMNRVFPCLDHVFAQWDQSWFGCQPSLLFSQKVPWWWASEAFCLGYFSYFPMIWTLVTWMAFRHPQHLLRVAFVILTGFYLYYFIYIFLPVAGPQFYYQAEGVDAVQGIFPNLGHYFNTHQDFYPMPGGNGPFHYMVELTQAAGERPTAAFPSSHIGISTIVLMLCRRYQQKALFWCFLPFYLLLCCATVYIHAHYLVDAIFGLLSSFVVYYMVSRMYENLGGTDE